MAWTQRGIECYPLGSSVPIVTRPFSASECLWGGGFYMTPNLIKWKYSLSSSLMGLRQENRLLYGSHRCLPKTIVPCRYRYIFSHLYPLEQKILILLICWGWNKCSCSYYSLIYSFFLFLSFKLKSEYPDLQASKSTNQKLQISILYNRLRKSLFSCLINFNNLLIYLNMVEALGFCTNC